jgi:hypothetical protein
VRVRLLAFAFGLAAAAGCGAAPSTEPALAVVPRGSAAIAPPRSPEGVVLEVAAPMPAPVASSDARGVIVLAEPAPDEAVRDVLFAYLEALRHRDVDAIRQLLSPSAVRIDGARGHQGDREAMISLVQQWMRSRDFTKLAPAELVVPERIERYGALDLAAAKQTKPEDMAPSDLFVRLSIPPARPNADKPFDDDDLVFLLRPEAGKLHIVTVNEEPAPPAR